jgi:hypothetical protein
MPAPTIINDGTPYHASSNNVDMNGWTPGAMRLYRALEEYCHLKKQHTVEFSSAALMSLSKIKSRKTLSAARVVLAEDGVVDFVYVSARVLGVHVKRLTIVRGEGYLGQAHHGKVIHGDTEFDRSPRTQRSIENSVRICLAGHEAQKMFARRSHSGAGEDYRQAVDWALHVSDGLEDVANAWIEWLRLDIRHMLKSRWEFVEAVANELLKVHIPNTDQFEAVWQKVIADAFKAQYPNGIPVGRMTSA